VTPVTTVVAVVVPLELLILPVETAVVLPILAVDTLFTFPIEAVGALIPVTALTAGPLNPAEDITLPTARIGPVTKRSFKLAIGHHSLTFNCLIVSIIYKKGQYSLIENCPEKFEIAVGQFSIITKNCPTLMLEYDYRNDKHNFVTNVTHITLLSLITIF
jgi:hypothetical protein